MKLQQDLHIHTHCSCDGACAQIDAIVKGAQAAGMKHFGISDHLHTKFNLPDIEIARKEFLEYGPVPGFHFGIEVTCATQWECEKIAKRDFASCFTCEVHGKKFQTMTPIDGIMYGGPANGPLMVDLTKEDIERLAKENIIFHGAIDNKKLSSVYQNNDVFILPSYSEPWGLVVEEALNNGTPIILSDKIGCKDDVLDSNGLEFQCDSEQSLHNAIAKIVELDFYNSLR